MKLSFYLILPDHQRQCVALDDYYQHSHGESHPTGNGMRVLE